MQEQINKDLKQALLAGDKTTAETLRGLKGAILNEMIAQNARDSGLSDEQIQIILAKEAKKRQEAADLYKQGGSPERADAELAEKAIIDKYLPEQMSDEEVSKIVDEEVSSAGQVSMADMGRLIGAVKARTAGQADGSLIAKLVKEKISQ
ncbi:GatB/YqeY domain-containing protein [Candidatus Saccharibacteria bacterium]|nr:GatB/YqeY domain-containing protein [Candidatus Saccharibacteria bacterium]